MTVNVVDYTNLEMPRPGANTLHILSPTLLEVELINTKQLRFQRASANGTWWMTAANSTLRR